MLLQSVVLSSCEVAAFKAALYRSVSFQILSPYQEALWTVISLDSIYLDVTFWSFPVLCYAVTGTVTVLALFH